MLNTETFTIEAWVRDPTLASNGDQMPIVQYRNGDGSRFDFRVELDGQTLGLGMLKDGGGWNLVETTTPVTFDDGTWYHLAVTYDDNGSDTANDSVVRFYMTDLNDLGGQAVLVDEITGVPDLMDLSAGGHLAVGMAETAVTRTFGGMIDELRYTNRALQPHEFNLSLPAVPEPSTLALGLVALLLAGLTRRRP
jgi:hypothetical protein